MDNVLSGLAVHYPPLIAAYFHYLDEVDDALVDVAASQFDEKAVARAIELIEQFKRAINTEIDNAVLTMQSTIKSLEHLDFINSKGGPNG